MTQHVDATADRAAGALLASACADALGAGYEFGPALSPDAAVGMIGGGPAGFAPGEWTDDTSMMIPIARAAADGLDLRMATALDTIAAGLFDWLDGGPKDVGIQTGAVMRAAASRSAADLAIAAADHHRANPERSAGNGSLMRTAPVALAHLLDPVAIADAARRVSDLTHPDPVCAEACVLWSVAIGHAVVFGTFDGVREALHLLPAGRAGFWSQRLSEAEARPASSFSSNGWVVHALQAAWSAISRTPVPGDDPAGHLRLALERAVRVGNDTDTVACIAGALLGARWGASAVPSEWVSIVHGWPGLTAPDLADLGVRALRHSAGAPEGQRSGEEAADE